MVSEIHVLHHTSTSGQYASYIAILALDSAPKFSRADHLSPPYLVAAPHLFVKPRRHSVVNPPCPPPSRIYQKFVPVQGQLLQIVERHPRSVGQTSCLEHRPGQNLHFQFLSSNVLHCLDAQSRTALNRRGLKTRR